MKRLLLVAIGYLIFLSFSSFLQTPSVIDLADTSGGDFANITITKTD